jgi:hypothetical protein
MQIVHTLETGLKERLKLTRRRWGSLAVLQLAIMLVFVMVRELVFVMVRAISPISTCCIHHFTHQYMLHPPLHPSVHAASITSPISTCCIHHFILVSESAWVLSCIQQWNHSVVISYI